jgi:hypothetical protein
MIPTFRRWKEKDQQLEDRSSLIAPRAGVK